MTRAFKYYKCEGAALDTLRMYKDELDALVEARTALEKKFEEEYARLQERHKSNLREIWRRMAAMVGLDPDSTWGSPEYQIEARYLKDGFGAVLFTPREPHPLQAVLGVGDNPEEQSDELPISIPDKSRLN